MEDVEIDSFVKKFKMLRSVGYDATLNLESKLGEVFITLNCKVGRVLPPPSTPTSVVSKHRSPSYYRRLARRKAARDSNSEHVVLAEQANNDPIESYSENAEEAHEHDSEKVEESTVALTDDDDDEEDEVEVVDVCTETADEVSDNLSEQLNALIMESRKHREHWDKLKIAEQNG